MAIYAHITGWGMAVPDTVLTNDDIAKLVDTSDKWIRVLTGVQERRIANEQETTASLATSAALKALQVANVSPREVDLIIVSTSTPEHLFPSTASLVQNRIGAINAGAFDLSAACTGFIYALNLATQNIRAGSIKTAIVIGSETLSRFVDWSDRATCILFGDGAGAFVLQASKEEGGVVSAVLRSDGSGGDLLSLPAGGSALPATSQTLIEGKHYIHMNGREVFRFATKVMARSSEETLKKANWDIEDVSLIVPHQANIRIISAAAKGLKVPMEKIMVNLHKYGNTSTASIPIATVEAIQEKRINSGDKIVFVGFGAGLTWGALSIIWTGPHPRDKVVLFGFIRFFARLFAWYQRIIRRIEGLIWGRNINHKNRKR
jgi:3-oxoacyl-[acyl-carrier-protein] synthase-3